MGRVVGLADSFSSIAEPPVTQHEADASESEILAMVASKATVYNSAANSVVLSVHAGIDTHLQKATSPCTPRM